MQMIVCPGCERPNGQAARFCLYCGYRFHAEPVSAAWGHEAPRAAGVREAQVCDHCAAPLHGRPGELQLRCDYCGSRYAAPGAAGGAPPVIIVQNSEPAAGGFEGDAAGAVLGEVVDTLFSGAPRRGRVEWEVFKFGQSGCLLALIFLPVRIVTRIFFRGW